MSNKKRYLTCAKEFFFKNNFLYLNIFAVACVVILSIPLMVNSAEDPLQGNPKKGERDFGAGSELVAGQTKRNPLIVEGMLAPQLLELDVAANAFISLRNNLFPGSTKDDVAEICNTLATTDFIQQCQKLLNKRVGQLKSLTGLTGADFPGGSIRIREDVGNVVDVEWKEVLLFGTKQQVGSFHIRIFYSKIKELWKIRKIEEL